MNNPRRFYSAWHEIPLADSREVTDGLLRPEYLGGSPELTRYLAEWPGAWYWGDQAKSRLVLIRGLATPRPERWLWHGALFLMTVCCTLGAGAVLAGVVSPPMYRGFLGLLESIPAYGIFLLEGGWRAILPGWEFAAPLLTILLVHEFGHYLAARRYAIDVSPPYFIPIPPNLSPIGGMGAFLRLRTPVYDRRQLLDVGAAGPLAGFVVALAVLFWGYGMSSRLPTAGGISGTMILFAGKPVWLGNSLLTDTLQRWLVPGTGPVMLAPEAFAGWVGMFLTGLNLLPLSQLDGGHVLYGMLGRNQRIISILAVIGLAIIGRSAPMWYGWIALTFIIGGGKWSHPAVVLPERGVLKAGWRTGIACIVVFVLTFVAVPFR